MTETHPLFRLDLVEASYRIGQRLPMCMAPECEAFGGYIVRVEHDRQRAEQRACAEHLEQVANAAIQLADATAIRIAFGGVGDDDHGGHR